MSTIKPFSFKFNNKSSRDFGLLATSYDVIIPPKRARKVIVPGRSGAYNYGAKYFDERVLRLSCIWINSKQRKDIREISYWLSREGDIILDVEPDKHYVGELYNAAELVAHYQKWGNMPTTDGNFKLDFVCKPFAFDNQPTMLYSTETQIIPNYKGTAETPTRVIIRNKDTIPMTGIRIIMRKVVR